MSHQAVQNLTPCCSHLDVCSACCVGRSIMPGSLCEPHVTGVPSRGPQMALLGQCRQGIARKPGRARRPEASIRIVLAGASPG